MADREAGPVAVDARDPWPIQKRGREQVGPVAVDAGDTWPIEKLGLWPWMHGAHGRQTRRDSFETLTLESRVGIQDRCSGPWPVLWSSAYFVVGLATV